MTLTMPSCVIAHGFLAHELLYGKRLMPNLRLAREASVEQLADGANMFPEQVAEAD
jgi:hypothetical protein